jgi:translation initiation factor IF-1
MAKEETINMEGRVEEILPAAMFRIKLDSLDTTVLGHLGIVWKLNLHLTI